MIGELRVKNNNRVGRDADTLKNGLRSFASALRLIILSCAWIVLRHGLDTTTSSFAKDNFRTRQAEPNRGWSKLSHSEQDKSYASADQLWSMPESLQQNAQDATKPVDLT